MSLTVSVPLRRSETVTTVQAVPFAVAGNTIKFPVIRATLANETRTRVRIKRSFGQALTEVRLPVSTIRSIFGTLGATEMAMKLIHKADRPWSRRLLSLHAADRVSGEDLTALVRLLMTSDTEHWPTPGVFPGEEGGLRVEWHEGRSHATFEVDDDGSMYAYFFDFARRSEADAEPRSVDDAVRFLREHLSA